MDMNWQAMLREAADASFEKNIESLAAADNDACSYVDLPKAKIQELSEKILRLPHQGIVLLLVDTASGYPQKKRKSSFNWKMQKDDSAFTASCFRPIWGLVRHK